MIEILSMTSSQLSNIGPVDRLSQVLDNAVSIGIISHSHPDGDAAGSCYAMRKFILNKYPDVKECRILLEDDIPSTLDFIRDESEKNDTVIYTESAEQLSDYVNRCDTLIFQDLNSISRTGSMAGVFNCNNANKILIDHHLNPDNDSFDLVFSRTDISSASELVFYILSELCRTDIPNECLNPLMTGITTDTNNFGNSVFSSTLHAVAYLLDKGADREGIIQHLYNEYPERRVRLMAHLLKDKMTILPSGTAYMILSKETAEEYGIQPGETEGLVNIPLSIDKVKLSIFAREDEDNFRISLRSKKGVSSNTLASMHFNGGGHELASGGKLKKEDGFTNADRVEHYIVSVTDDYMNNER